MVYTLVSAATLGFDLSRLPAGRHVAEALVIGLGADAAVLRRIAEHQAVGASGSGLDAASSRRARRLAAVDSRGLAAVAAAPAGTPAGLVAQLERSMLGDAPALERLVHGDLLDPAVVDPAVVDPAPIDPAPLDPAAASAAAPAPATAVDTDTADRARSAIADAALAAYAAEALPSDVRRELSRPFREATGAGSRPLPEIDLGPQTTALRGVLSGVAALDGAGRQAWREAVDTVRARQRSWATGMHEACWAAHVAGRTRAVAAAQMLAVIAVDDAGFDAADVAGGVWNAVAGVVQGIALADLLGDEVLEVLLAPWTVVTGVTPLA